MRKGFTLIAAVFIIVVLTFLAIAFSTYISSYSRLAVVNHICQDAFCIAESGMDIYLKELRQDDDWSTPPPPLTKEFSGGMFSVVTTDESRNRVTLTVTGILTADAKTYTRTIRSTVRKTGSLSNIAEEYVVYWSGGGDPSNLTSIGDNIQTNGSMLVNSDLAIGNNTIISGDAFAAGDITLGGASSTITGTSESDYDMPASVPTLETSRYDNEIAAAAAMPAGDWTFGTITLTGIYYVNGDVTIVPNATITITETATIVATGKVTVRGNASIDEGLEVIAGGDLELRSDVNVHRSGRWYSATGINVGNGFNLGDPGAGEGIHFITPGDLIIGNNTMFDGLIFGDNSVTIGNNMNFSGVVLTGYLKEMGLDSQLAVNPAVTDWDNIPGVESEGGALEITLWDEVY